MEASHADRAVGSTLRTGRTEGIRRLSHALVESGSCNVILPPSLDPSPESEGLLSVPARSELFGLDFYCCVNELGRRPASDQRSPLCLTRTGGRRSAWAAAVVSEVLPCASRLQRRVG
ncbi:hypothetical protein GN956_G1714 [Arapaima gigas]